MSMLSEAHGWAVGDGASVPSLVAEHINIFLYYFARGLIMHYLFTIKYKHIASVW